LHPPSTTRLIARWSDDEGQTKAAGVDARLIEGKVYDFQLDSNCPEDRPTLVLSWTNVFFSGQFML